MTATTLLLVLFSAALHAGWNATTKQSASPTAFLFWMIALTCALLAPVVLFTDFGDIDTGLWIWFLLSGAVHALYFLFLSRAYAGDDLTFVYPIARSTPAIVPLVAIPAFGERLTLAGATGILLVVLSLWLIQSGSEGFSWRGLLRSGNIYAYLTLLATVAYALTDAAVMKRLDQMDWHGTAPRALSFVLFQGVIQLVLFGAMARTDLAKQEVRATLRSNRRAMLFAVIGSLVSYWLILEAMRTAPVSYIVAIRQASVLFALWIGLVWLNERPSSRRLLGIVGTVAGIALIALAG